MEKLVVIHNAETDEIIERPATKEELEQMEKDRLEAIKKSAEDEAKIAQRQAILNRLGLTEEEVKLLLG